MSQPLLSVHNLSIDFKSGVEVTPAVKNISFTVAPGEIVAIVGESGSGKSVTSLSLMQLLPGEASVSGRLDFTPDENTSINLREISEKKMAAVRGNSIAMIFQEPMTSLNPVFTCGFQVVEAIRLHQHLSAADAKKLAVELFEKVKLPVPHEIMKRYPHQLSGGQKQRVMIAMAISCNPALLIADEPTTALDVTVQRNILELIKELQLQTGMSVLLVTHDLGLVADIADRVLVMYKGEIAEQGTAASVLSNPHHPYTRALLNCRPGMHQRGDRLPVVGDFLSSGPGVFQADETDTRIADRSLPAGEKVNGNDPVAQRTISTIDHIGPAAGETIVLSVQRLTVLFKQKRNLFGKRPAPFKAVDDVSFTIYKGETVGLVGESGCGKTTLGRAILQLIPADAGTVILNGMALNKLSKSAMRHVREDLQIVFQDPYGSLNPRITIGTAIAEPMMVHSILPGRGARKNKVMELLEKVDLKPEHFNRYPHQFSGGQRQRICIARALALNPSFLIFDESVSALDVSVQAQVLNLLNDLKKDFGFTAVFISHDLSVVRFISDRILVMHNGKIIEEGPSDQVYFNPQNEYTKKLLQAIPGKKINPFTTGL